MFLTDIVINGSVPEVIEINFSKQYKVSSFIVNNKMVLTSDSVIYFEGTSFSIVGFSQYLWINRSQIQNLAVWSKRIYTRLTLVIPRPIDLQFRSLIEMTRSGDGTEYPIHSTVASACEIFFLDIADDMKLTPVCFIDWFARKGLQRRQVYRFYELESNWIILIQIKDYHSLSSLLGKYAFLKN